MRKMAFYSKGLLSILLITSVVLSSCQKEEKQEILSGQQKQLETTSSTGTTGVKTLDLSRVALYSGNAYHINNWFGVGGDTKLTTTSTLKVFENDKELGAAHSLLSDVVTYGRGKFSHFGNDLYFSSSDNTDPRTNGRKYTYTIDGSSPAPAAHVQPGGNIVITVQFNTNPTSASSVFTNLKHEKHSVINFEWDDAVRDVLTAQQIFSGKTFTDGAGNNKKYALAVNTNGRFHYTNSEVGATPALAITYAEGMAIVAAGGDIANHAMYHDPQGSGRNYPNVYISPSDMVKQLEALYFSKTGYRMNVMVVPTNYAGFMQSAHDQGYIAGTTTSAPDAFTLYPTGWVNTGNVALLPNDTKFTAFGRQFTDDWGGIVPTYKQYINELLSGTSPTVNKYMRIGSHNVSNVAGFTEIINYIQTQSNDRIWVASLREFAEYRAAKALTVKSEQLVGNTLTITLDQSSIGSRIRWRDLTLKIASNASISSVNVTGADGHSANLGNKLINIFKQDLRFGN